MKLIGIAGMPRSGKDTLAELFLEASYYGVSFGDIVREFARERHQDTPDPISVANMTETSNWLRENRGPDVILEEALRQFNDQPTDKYKGLVLYSVRAPTEVDFILGHGGELIWVEASEEVRYARAMQNLRDGEAKISPEEFRRQETLQWQPQPGSSSEAQMNLSYVKAKATKTFENNGDDIQVFKNEAEKVLREVL